MRHGEGNVLKDQAYGKKLRVSPRNPGECGPAESEQQAVAARHVRRRVVGVLRDVPRAPGEIEIDGVSSPRKV